MKGCLRTLAAGKNSTPFNGDNHDFYFNKGENVKGSVATEHYHSAFELYYMKDGNCNYFIEDHSYDVASGDIILIPAGTIHRTNYDENPHSRHLINFADGFISSDILNATQELGHIYSNKKILSYIDTVFAMIESEYLKKDALSIHALKTHTEQLLLALIRNENEKKNEYVNDSIVEKTVRHIQENYMNEVKLSDVSRLMNVSAEHLSRIFKKDTGFGFNEYLTLYRLKMAEYMLVNQHEKRVGEIAYSCGFNDSNYFSYKFKQRYGVSPKEARNSVGVGKTRKNG